MNIAPTKNLPLLNGCLQWRNKTLWIENKRVSALAAEFPTPAYIYSRRTIESNWKMLHASLGDNRKYTIHFAVKACSNLAVLHLLSQLGSGFDIVSEGELLRVLKAGGRAQTVVFSGVGKKPQEIKRALKVGIGCFNVESFSELKTIENFAEKLSMSAPISIRINPNIDAHTHPYITTGLDANKFGVDIGQAMTMYDYVKYSHSLQTEGIDCHIGSQITDLTVLKQAYIQMLHLADDLRGKGHNIRHIDLGGGLGICYQKEKTPSIKQWAHLIGSIFDKSPYRILLEPGRSITGDAGLLLCRVLCIKQRKNRSFAVVDAAMNDLIRPAMYHAHHEIIPVVPHNPSLTQTYDIVGPVCETADTLGKNRSLAIKEGDYLVVADTGAYGFSMSSNYNARPRPCEIIVDGHEHFVVRLAEGMQDLWAGESIPKQWCQPHSAPQTHNT